MTNLYNPCPICKSTTIQAIDTKIMCGNCYFSREEPSLAEAIEKWNTPYGR